MAAPYNRSTGAITTVRFVEVRRNGQRHRGTFGTLAEATAWRLKALDAADGRSEAPTAGVGRPAAAALPSDGTVEDAARTLLRAMEGDFHNKRGEAYKPSAFRAYETSLRRSVVPRLGALPVAALTRGEVQRFVDAVASALSPPPAPGGERSSAQSRSASSVAGPFDERLAHRRMALAGPGGTARPPVAMRPISGRRPAGGQRGRKGVSGTTPC